MLSFLKNHSLIIVVAAVWSLITHYYLYSFTCFALGLITTVTISILESLRYPVDMPKIYDYIWHIRRMKQKEIQQTIVSEIHPLVEEITEITKVNNNAQ